jgi:hypothetical protein
MQRLLGRMEQEIKSAYNSTYPKGGVSGSRKTLAVI